MAPYAGLGLILLASVAMPAGDELPIAAFTASQYWATDNGGSVARLGWPQQAVLLVRASSRRPTFMSVPGGCSIYEAALSPDRDRIAYSRIDWGADRFGNDPSHWGVTVADTAGREVASFPGACRFRWSPDGARLALAIAHHDTNWSWTAVAVEVWRRSDGARRRWNHAARDVRWGQGDTLYLMFDDRVRALDLARGRLSATRHFGPDASPDRRFSMRHYTPDGSGTELFDDRDSLNLMHCTLYKHNAAPLGGYAPFWVSGTAHLLCTTIGDGGTVPLQQAGFETGVFDPLTLEMVARFPGKPIVPTADGRAVVVVRGDTLAVESIDHVREPRSGTLAVRVRTELLSWGRRIDTVGVWTDQVAQGEWVPDHYQRTGACERLLRVARVIDRDHIELEVPEGAYTVDAPGVVATQGGLTPVSRIPTRLRTNSTCGGYIYRFSIVD
jgi:hypothetical protein